MAARRMMYLLNRRFALRIKMILWVGDGNRVPQEAEYKFTLPGRDRLAVVSVANVEGSL